MKLSRLCFAGTLFLNLLAFGAFQCAAATFLVNTTIGPGNSNYDGGPVVVSNCTVTIDGPHSFSSVEVGAGGVLTHSIVPGGVTTNFLYITNEPQTLSSTNPATLDYSNVLASTISVTDMTGTTNYTNGVDYTVASADGLTQLLLTTNSSITNGAETLVNYTAQTFLPAGLDLTISGSLQVDAGGMIDADGKGFAGGAGPGAGSVQGSGGAYGGNGGASSISPGGAAYGSYNQPVAQGSSGGPGSSGPGAAGGGAIQISAAGNIVINGSVSANGATGTNSRAGGGAGGSVWLSGGNLFGSGDISANGGGGDPADAGGGAGGRISLQCGTNFFVGGISAYGGSGSNWGGAGTVYVQTSGSNGLLILDNDSHTGALTPLAVSDQSLNLLIRSNADASAAAALAVGSLTIGSNSTLTAADMAPLNLTAVGPISVQEGGAITADGEGYGANGGGGTGGFYNDELRWPCGGGGFGGNGGAGSSGKAPGGPAYGLLTSPGYFGSGGGSLLPYSIGGAGGGEILLISAVGVINVDGRISANGLDGSGSAGGGGSGGYILITGGTLTGSGSITVNGGDGANGYGGGGAGGRIYATPNANLLTGVISAYGGAGANWGGAGTIYYGSISAPQLILDNGGHLGTNTPLQTAEAADLTIRGGAIGSPAGELNFKDLYIYSNGWIMATFNTFNLFFGGNALIQAGGGILADNAGNPAQEGQGAGRAFGLNGTEVGSGAGHGGLGGASEGDAALGGITYDLLTEPSLPGSGGGGVSLGASGGPGGGVVRLSVTGNLELDGAVSANGGAGAGGGGGGSGGSIWLSVGGFQGAGSITANGGDSPEGTGGGGGGGIIYVSYTSNYFTGTATAYGGSGANWGGPGLVSTQIPGKNDELIIDNGSVSGALTPLPNNSLIDVVLRDGSSASITGQSLSLGNVEIGSNCLVVVSNESVGTLAFSQLDIAAGGTFSADATGSNVGDGLGKSADTSPDYPCGGGGYGGAGGASISNSVPGGQTYDSVTEPIDPGSAGGSLSPYSVGGAGGGAIALSVASRLQIDGVLSADGGNGSGMGGGGGSGGEIKITTATLAGVGTIRANGGAGANAIGGGGGGGRISLSASSNLFVGNMTAYGGGGANFGGAGTIYIGNVQSGQLIVNNGGNVGTNTPLQTLDDCQVIVGGGAIANATTASFGSLLIQSNGWFEPIYSQNPSVLNLQLTGNATIENGGGINANLAGYAGNSGEFVLGTGYSGTYGSTNTGGGGGHGGSGGGSVANYSAGGVCNAAVVHPIQAGSAGGTANSQFPAGSGGGVVELTVGGILQIDGTISANGGNAPGWGAGGGAGGSISLSVGALAGAGSINASGGNGFTNIGGGGGGGVIYVLCDSNLFSGTMTAYGGSGANWGGQGLITLQTNGQNLLLILDAGGNPGAGTSLPFSSTLNLLMRNGAYAISSNTDVSLANAVINSNCWIRMTNLHSTAFASVAFSSLEIQAGGGILADGGGYSSGAGFGPGQSLSSAPNYAGGGGGHGGYGGGIPSSPLGGVPYDSITFPIEVGSGGGGTSPYSVGGAGGGSFAVTVAGLLELDGTISASGAAGSGLGGGGGSGGTIYLTTGTIAGSGEIRALGGAGAAGIGGGGSGGCILLSPGVNLFAGKISAAGGNGAIAGGAGSIFITSNGETGQLILDNGGQSGASTPIGVLGGSSVTVTNGAIGYQPLESQTLTGLFIGSNSWLTANPMVPNNATGRVSFTVTGSMEIAAGGGIVTDAAGSTAGSGEGGFAEVGSEYPGGGGGYGGAGGNGGPAAGGVVYGSIVAPNGLGSGGGSQSPYSTGGAGGGSVTLNVSGTLDVDGKISANGGNGSGLGGGGGSGGSIALTAGTLLGDGAITANGGTGANAIGGGGGGGRIALLYGGDEFAGSVSADGGDGAAAGGAGTIYTKATAQAVGQVLVDNGGPAGAPTLITSQLGTPPQAFDLTIQNGGVVSASANFPALSDLILNAGGVLTAAAQLTALNVNVNNNAVVAEGGSIEVDGEGYPQEIGPGTGISSGQDGSGAGYGGTGGAAGSAPGGGTYGSAYQPADFGSGGGYGSFASSAGSSGGGAMHLIVGGALTLDGQISAEGQAGAQDNAGGGSGGSVWVQAATLIGGGEIRADGGNGAGYGGSGGGGGRIAFYAGNNLFAGETSVLGGTGQNPGAAGTVVDENSAPFLEVLSVLPSGMVSNSVSSAVINFNTAPNPNPAVSSSIVITTPNGVLSPAALTLVTSNNSYLASFPAQTAPGLYTIAVTTNAADAYGNPLLQPYTGSFTIAPPSGQLISASVASGNFSLAWQGVAGVNYQIYSSSNLVTWQPYGGVISGSNAPIVVSAPLSNGSQLFFSLQTNN